MSENKTVTMRQDIVESNEDCAVDYEYATKGEILDVLRDDGYTLELFTSDDIPFTVHESKVIRNYEK